MTYDEIYSKGLIKGPIPKVNLIGTHCNNLEVIEYAGYIIRHFPSRTKIQHIWRCRCDCGNNDYYIASQYIQTKTAKSCGCTRRKDMTGMRFGKLKVIEYAGEYKDGSSLWKCKCDCGNYRITLNGQLQAGIATMCNNCAKEKQRRAVYKHGLTNSRLYKTLRRMKTRCYNKNHQHYALYGGRGIKICDDWNTPDDPSIGFMRFYKWSLNNGYYDQPKDTPYSELLSIDRIGPNGDYTPDNCRWITIREQQSNKRNNHWIFDGEEILTLTQFERKYDFKNKGVYNRLANGHTMDEIIYEAKFGINVLHNRDKDGFLRLIKHYPQPNDDIF